MIQAHIETGFLHAKKNITLDHIRLSLRIP
jgi:hypothetical protein